MPTVLTLVLLTKLKIFQNKLQTASRYFFFCDEQLIEFKQALC